MSERHLPKKKVIYNVDNMAKDKFVVLPEDKMARYIEYCLNHKTEVYDCPTCHKPSQQLAMFPYFYDWENNDVYFASRCPNCGGLIITKE